VLEVEPIGHHGYVLPKVAEMSLKPK